MVEQRLHHDPDRVGEVDEPGALRASAVGLLRDVEHDRHGAQGLGEPARSCRFLADAAELERKRLVDEPRRLASDAELDDDEARAVERAVAVLRDDERPRPLVLVEDPLRQTADDLEALVVDVVEHELVDG